MQEFWEKAFTELGTSWGFQPAVSAVMAKEIFLKKQFKKILIPGIGYGRNARIFLENGMDVSGIEISAKAIELARSENNLDISIIHGSVTDMPFNNDIYDGIYCYAVLHLLNKPERARMINACYNQLEKNGIMIFIVISSLSPAFGQGRKISRNRFVHSNGIKVFFYNQDAILQEFRNAGLVEFFEMEEPVKHISGEDPMKFVFVKCKKS